MFNESGDADVNKESTPKSDPDDWKRMKGADQAYYPKGEKKPIFEKDRAGNIAKKLIMTYKT